MSATELTARLPPVDTDRLWSSLEAAGRIGPFRECGVQRLALSDADRQMRDTFCGWCEEAGLRVTVDRVGNIFARRNGTEPLEPVMVGSHLDTQVAGGRYDGALGVLAALEVVRWLDDHDLTTRRPVEVVAWTGEEGARFRPPMLGSAAFAGALTLEAVLDQTDDKGLRLGDELERIGYAGPAEVPGRPPPAYLELHIEQDDTLHRSGLDLGIVTSAYVTRGMTLRLTGATAHAGATPMRRRRDPLAGAAELVSALDALACSDADGDDMRATATRLEAWPGRPGITAGEVRLTLDYRHATEAGLARMTGELKRAVEDVCDRRGLNCNHEEEWEFGRGISFDPGLAAIARRQAAELGVAATEMASAAGHDAYWLATVAPSLILFAPCVDGVTHNEHEAIEPERVAPSVNVLAATVLEAARQ